jgi:predicted transcriptional regulator
MKPLCESVSQQILPAVRAVLAKKLIENYNLSQNQVAFLLETTQPAISQYKRDARGYKDGIFDDNPNLIEIIDSIARRLASGEISPQQSNGEFCKICQILHQEAAVCPVSEIFK